jgi:type II secretory pathway pseudopilin PulG
MHPRRPTTRRAYTIIEAIATITILAAIGTVASSMILSATSAWRDAAVTAQLHDELSTALERIAKELRSIAPDTDAPGPAPLISSLTPTALAYNASSALALAGDELTLIDAGAAPVTLLADVSAFSLRAYDDAGAPLATSLAATDCRQIRRIEVQITLRRQGVTHTLRTRIFLRSTMTGAPA